MLWQYFFRVQNENLQLHRTAWNHPRPQHYFEELLVNKAACGSCECDDGKFAATALESPGSAAIRLESLCCCAMETGSPKYILLL